MIEILLLIFRSLLSVCFVLGSIALVHELGHFLTAKAVKIWVFEFAIGFGNRLFKYKLGETLYSLRPFPLGGFVRLAGMEGEEEEEEKKPEDPNKSTTSDGKETDESVKDPEEDEFPQLAPDDPRGFPAKHKFQKLLVLAAGSIMNLLWAIVLFVTIYAVSGGPLTNIYIQDVHSESPAEKAGLKSGDIIVSINGQKIEDWADGVSQIQKSDGTELALEIQRNHPVPKPGFGGAILQGEYAVNRGTYEVHDQETVVIKVIPIGNPGSARIGITLAPNHFDFSAMPFGKAVKKGFMTGIETIQQTLLGLYKMVTRETQADVAGPVKIMKMIKDQSGKGFFDLLYLTAILSINIGLINLLPLPVLDGGRMAFVLLEGLFSVINKLIGTRLAITPKWEEKVHFVGLLLLLSLLIIVTFNDIRSFFRQ